MTDAIEKKARLYRTLGYYAAFLALGLSTASMGPTLPGLAENTRSALSQISFLFTGRSLGYLLGSLLGGRGYDRIRGHRLMGLTLLLVAGGLALVPLTAKLAVLAAVLFFVGMGEGMLDLGGNVLLMWTHRDRVPPYMNGLHFFFGVGAFIAPLLIAWLVALQGGAITWAYWALAAYCLPVALYLFGLPSPAHPSTLEGHEHRPADGLLVGMIAFLLFVYVGAEAGYGGWIFTYAIRQTAVGDLSAVAALLTSVFWGALTAGRLLSIPLAGRFRPPAVLLGDILACLVSMAVILLFPASALALWAGTIGLGLGMASIFPTALSWAERQMSITGDTTRWFLVGSGAGGMFLPWLIGQLFEPWGPTLALSTILAALVVQAGVYALIVLRVCQTAGRATAERAAEAALQSPPAVDSNR